MEKYIKRFYVTCSARNLKSLPSRLNSGSSYLKTSQILAAAKPVTAGTKKTKTKHSKSDSSVLIQSKSASTVESMLLGTKAPEYITPDVTDKEYPKLQHDLESVLFNPGVHYLRDPRTNMYNFDPYLRFITQPDSFDYTKIPSFTPPSEDQVLLKLASEKKAKFTGSTSSTSSALSQIYFMLDDSAAVSLESLPAAFQEMLSTFTKFTKSPTMVTLLPRDNDVYAITKYEPGSKETILSRLGSSMELFFTTPQDKYGAFLKDEETAASEASGPSTNTKTFDYYAYCMADDVLFRSQLDCYNPHLPRKWFDIKTRATVAIRHNIQDYAKFIDYRLNQVDGVHNSFTREYYDMMRSSFLKYNFQVKIGNMDGLFVAYHNTEEIFGFQYVSREDLDKNLFGSPEAGDQFFHLATQTMSILFNEVVKEWPGEPIRVLLNARKNGTMYLWGERVSVNDPLDIDDATKNSVSKGSMRMWKVSAETFINGKPSEGSSYYLGPRDQLETLVKITRDPQDRTEEYLGHRSKYLDLIEKSGSGSSTESMLKWMKRYFSSIDVDEPVIRRN